jgi:hypothetical protein
VAAPGTEHPHAHSEETVVTAFLSLLRCPPSLAGFVGPHRMPSAIGRREMSAAALVGGAQLLLVCGVAFLMALVCSAVLGPTP